MTLPYERTNAVNYTRDFLYDLLDPQKTPRVPKEIRIRAGQLLKHYPSEYEMNQVSDPLFGKDTLRQILRERLAPTTPTIGIGCPVCGLGSDGKPIGYVCNNPKCPTRITC
jgi:hypothetical protein